MSIEVMNWAWKLRLTATQKIVMVALADRANDDWECWPGQQSLAEKCSLSERGVRKVLSEIEAMGYLKIESRHDGKHQKTNLYRLVEHPDQPEPCAACSPDQPEPCAGTSRNHVPPLYKMNHQVESSVSAPSSSSATKKPADDAITFDAVVNEFRGIAESQFSKWELLFKKIDVIAEIEKAEAWLQANPRKRKKHYDRFLLNWFSRASDRLTKAAVPFISKPQSGRLA